MKKMEQQDVLIKELTTTRGSLEGYHDVIKLEAGKHF